MKTLFLSVLLTYVLVGFSATYQWKGTVNSNYQEATNWFPTRSIPTSSDTLVFSEKGVIENVQSETISTMLVSDSVSFLSNGKITLTIDYLSIPIDGYLTLSGENVIELSIQKQAKIQGVFIVDGKTDLHHRLLGEHQESIVFDSLAICQVNNLNGNLFGKTGAKEVVTFKNGATYWAKDGGNPFGYSAPYSKVIFDPQSIYLHEHGYAPSLGGRKYGILMFNYDSDVSINFGSTYSTVIEKLIIQKGNININTQTNTKSLNLEVKKWEMSSNTTFTYNPSFASTFKLFTDTLPKNCTFGEQVTLQVFSDTLYLQENLIIKGVLDLNGIIKTNNYELTIKNTNSNSLLFSQGFIDGKLIRYIETNEIYDFPVGQTTIQLATINTNDLEGVEYITSEFIKTELPLTTIYGLENIDAFLDHGYWKIEPNQQPTKGTYHIELSAQNYTNELEGKEVKVVKRETEDEVWEYQGVSQSTLQNQGQVIIQSNDYTSFSHFAFVEGKDVVLPLVLKDFQLIENDLEYVFQWEMYDEEEGIYQLKMSEYGNDYQTLVETPVSDHLVYQESHQKVKANYFQLCHNDQPLMTIYKEYEESATILPNPSQYQAHLFFESQFTGIVEIYDVVGNCQFSQEVINCSKLTLPVLSIGMYIVRYGVNTKQWIVK